MVSLDRYEVSRNGVIFDKQKNRIIKPFKSNKYLQVCIYDENGKHVMGVHNVVAQLYCEDWYEGCVVHHKDNNQHNNSVENLECLSNKQHTKLHNPNKYKDIEKTCPICGKRFIWTQKAQHNFVSNKSQEGPFCSKKCACKPPENKRKIKCLETNIIYESIMQASKDLKISYSQLWRCVKGDLQTAHSLHFEYA